MESFETQLRLIKKKNKHTICRCLLNYRTKEITLFELKSNKILARFNLHDCEKISKYNDMSWEITYKANKSYRLISENQEENLKWYNMINAIFNRGDSCTHDYNVSNVDEDETLSHVSSFDKALSDDIYDMLIDRDLTDPRFFTKFALDSTYLITIDESGISLQDKNTGSMHAFESNIIKRYGSTNECFAFELGNNSEYGHGLIALISRKKDAKLIYDHLNETTDKKFRNLLKKYETLQSVQAQVVNQPNNYNNVAPTTLIQQQEPVNFIDEVITKKPNYKSVDSNKENSYYKVINEYKNIINETANNHHVYNAYEIKIDVEPRPADKVFTNNNISLILTKSKNEYEYSDSDDITETDESFYQDKYRPQYMSNKNLKSTAIEYFKDVDNDVVYGKVKL